MKPINRTYIPEVGMALATKNGQWTGNAFILSKETPPKGREDCAVLYTILTDFGHTFKLFEYELIDRYDVANWWWSELAIFEEYGFTSNGVDIRCPKQRIQRQMERLTELLNELEEKE
jgi:hypothetical protein